jgi:tetratricopeptide (TPR) repeat protein
LLTGWLWYLGTLVPVIGIVQVGSQALADRYTYITLIGLFIIIAWGLPELLAKWRYKKIALTLSALLIILVMSICTYFQLRHWRNSLTLFQHAIDVTEDNYIAHYCIAEYLREQGTLDKAIYHYSEAVRIKPDYIKALNNLAVTLCGAERINEAIYYYKRALETNPSLAEVHANLGLIFATKGDFTEAVRHYKIAIETIDTPRIHSDLGYVLLNLGRFHEAVKEYEKILSIQPQNATAHNDLGVALFQQGKFDQAIAHFNQAIRIDPNYAAARKNLNLALAEKPQNKDTENTKK